MSLVSCNLLCIYMCQILPPFWKKLRVSYWTYFKSGVELKQQYSENIVLGILFFLTRESWLASEMHMVDYFIKYWSWFYVTPQMANETTNFPASVCTGFVKIEYTTTWQMNQMSVYRGLRSFNHRTCLFVIIFFCRRYGSHLHYMIDMPSKNTFMVCKKMWTVYETRNYTPVILIMVRVKP